MNIEIKNLSQIFGKGNTRVVALNHINLSIKPGDFISVVGPSGSGKSTLLLTMAGLIAPSEGEVIYNDQQIFKLSPYERAKIRLENIGFVFQLFYLVPYLTAIENVQVALLASSKKKNEQHRLAAELLKKVGLENRFYHKPEELSVGERQRVALARALANKPKIILADEPTGNLDPDRKIEVLDFLAHCNREGISIVLVSHDSAVSKYAPQQLEIKNGNLSFHPGKI